MSFIATTANINDIKPAEKQEEKPSEKPKEEDIQDENVCLACGGVGCSICKKKKEE